VPRRSSPFIRWTDLPSRNAAFSLGSSASHATTCASAPLRSASIITLPGSGTNIFRMFGRRNSVLDDGASDCGREDKFCNAVFVGDIMGLEAAVVEEDD